MPVRLNRKNDEIRNVIIKKNIMENAYSNILIEMGKTKILCSVSIKENVPDYINEKESGWLTAEYNLLPGSTHIRKARDFLKLDSRSVEIQRLIGRSLRRAVDLKKIKGLSIIIDCDVIQADGGTRTLSITGSYIALKIAIGRMLKEGLINTDPLINQIASISAGIVDNEILLDLDYSEDRRAKVDFNVVMNEKGNFIEIQGTGEKGEISRDDLLKILDYCEKGIKELLKKQNDLFNK